MIGKLKLYFIVRFDRSERVCGSSHFIFGGSYFPCFLRGVGCFLSCIFALYSDRILTSIFTSLFAITHSSKNTKGEESAHHIQ